MGGVYDPYVIKDGQNRKWKVVSDASIHCTDRNGIVAVFILILAVSFISEIAGSNNAFTRNNAGIKINVSDLIILGVILISYIIVRFKKGVK